MTSRDDFSTPDGFEKATRLMILQTLRRCVPYAVAFACGAASMLAIGVYLAGTPPSPPLTDLRFTAPTGPALTVDHLTAKIAPVIQRELMDAKPDVLEHAGGPIERGAIRLAYPLAVREVPVFTEHGIRALTDEFGQYSVQDLVHLLEDAAATKGDREGRLLSQLKRTTP